MESFEVTKLSSKGQVVLPQTIRTKLDLDEGMKFIVLAQGDTVILKKISLPTLAHAKRLLAASQAWAKKVGLKQSDIKAAIRRVRAKSR